MTHIVPSRVVNHHSGEGTNVIYFWYPRSTEHGVHIAQVLTNYKVIADWDEPVPRAAGKIRLHFVVCA